MAPLKNKSRQFVSRNIELSARNRQLQVREVQHAGGALTMNLFRIL